MEVDVAARVFKFVKFYFFDFFMDLVWMGMGYLRKLCMILIDRTRRNKSRIDRVRNTRYRSSIGLSQYD